MAPSSTRIRRSRRAVSAAVASGRRADESDTGDPQWSDRAGWLGLRAPAPRRAVLELRRSGTSSHALISVQAGRRTSAWWARPGPDAIRPGQDAIGPGPDAIGPGPDGQAGADQPNTVVVR